MKDKLIMAAALVCGLVFMTHSLGDCSDEFRYEAKGKRDPLVSLISSVKTANVALENITSVEDITLEGIAMGPGGKNVAMMNGEMVKERDKIGLLEIKKISKDSVLISIEGTEYTLNLLEVEGGKGG